MRSYVRILNYIIFCSTKVSFYQINCIVLYIISCSVNRSIIKIVIFLIIIFTIVKVVICIVCAIVNF